MTLVRALRIVQARRFRPSAYPGFYGNLVALAAGVIALRLLANVYLAGVMAAGRPGGEALAFLRANLCWVLVVSATLLPAIALRSQSGLLDCERARLFPLRGAYRSAVFAALLGPQGAVALLLALASALGLLAAPRGVWLGGSLFALAALAGCACLFALALLAFRLLGAGSREGTVVEGASFALLVAANPELLSGPGGPTLRLFGHALVRLSDAGGPLDLALGALAIAVCLAAAARLAQAARAIQGSSFRRPIVKLYIRGVSAPLLALSLVAEIGAVALVRRDPELVGAVLGAAIGLQALLFLVFLARSEQLFNGSLGAPAGFRDRARVYAPALFAHVAICLLPLALLAGLAL